MRTANLLSSLLLTGLLVGLAPLASAQRNAGYTASRVVRPSPCAHSYSASRIWVPGHYESVCERVWVQGLNEQVWVDPVFELRLGSCGDAFRVLVSAGHWEAIHHPGHFEDRRRSVWTPGHWEAWRART